MVKVVRIRKHERGLRYRYGDLVEVLGPGRYVLWSRLYSRTRDVIRVVSTLTARLRLDELDAVLENEAVTQHLEVVRLGARERAVVWCDGCVLEVLGPGRYAYWKEPYRIEVERYSIDDVELEHEKLSSILEEADASKWLDGVAVQPYEEALLLRDGRLVKRLGPGKYVLWKGIGEISCATVDLRERVIEVGGQEIMTQDKVTLRATLVVGLRVVDTERALTRVDDYEQAVYRAAQLALRVAVGARSLDALLSGKESVADEITASIRDRAEEIGVEVRSVGLRDVILPGEMRTILNRVIEAEKEAQANLIRRREETAAARSQANTARLLAENPVLSRLKELELLQEILADTKATMVLGGGEILDQVSGLVSLKGDED